MNKEHLKRRFSVEVKAIGKQKAKGALAKQAALKISNLYHIDNKGKELPLEDRAEYRQNIVAPFVDEFFTWVRDNIKKFLRNQKQEKDLVMRSIRKNTCECF